MTALLKTEDRMKASQNNRSQLPTKVSTLCLRYSSSWLSIYILHNIT